MPAGSSPQTTPSAFSDAADRIRDSAKWLLGAFAGVGALLAAGLPLSDLGKLASAHNDHLLRWAIAGVAAALLGIGIAIGAATVVITRSFVTLKWLAHKDRRSKKLDGDKILLASHNSVKELYQEMSGALDAHRLAVVSWAAVPSPENRAIIADKSDVVYYYDQIVTRVVQQASFRRLTRSYSWARALMLIGAAIAASGIILFAWATHAP